MSKSAALTENPHKRHMQKCSRNTIYTIHVTSYVTSYAQSIFPHVTVLHDSFFFYTLFIYFHMKLLHKFIFTFIFNAITFFASHMQFQCINRLLLHMLRWYIIHITQMNMKNQWSRVKGVIFFFFP